MKLSLSFDDGRCDSIDAYHILKSNDLGATFFITTGYIDHSLKLDGFCGGKQPLTVKQIQEMFEGGMEIGSHGDKHITDSDDFDVSFRKINEMIEPNEKIGFAVPRSKYTSEELTSFYSKCEYNLSYIRVGRNPKCYAFFSKFHYFFYHKILRNYASFALFNRHNLQRDLDKKCIFSLVIKKDTKLEHLVKFIKKYSKKNVSLILMFHSIVDKPIDSWEWRKEDFEKLCNFIAEEKSGGFLDCIKINELL